MTYNPPPTPVTLQPITSQALERVKLMLDYIQLDLIKEEIARPKTMIIFNKRLDEYLNKEIEISKMEG